MYLEEDVAMQNQQHGLQWSENIPWHAWIEGGCWDTMMLHLP